MTAGRPVILFDGVCRLCHGFVQFVLKRDRAGTFVFAPLQSQYALERLGDIGLKSVVLLEGGKVYVAEDAVLRIFARLPAPCPLLSRVLNLLPRPLLAWGYRLIARHRYRLFGKSEHCMLPPAGSSGRFVA